jgi:hypothetical protein
MWQTLLTFIGSKIIGKVFKKDIDMKAKKPVAKKGKGTGKKKKGC